MNRSEFIKRMGAAALIPFVPNRTNYINSSIILVTNDDPINYRTVVHAYDMTLETVMDEYIPYDNDFLRAVTPYERKMTLSNLPDNYDRYELSVWRTERSGLITVDDVMAHWNVQPTKVYSQTFGYQFPTEIIIDLRNE